MSSRALRKAQREKEEQERLQQLEERTRALEDDADDSDEVVSKPAPKMSAFAVLGDENDDENGDHDGAEEQDDSEPEELPALKTTQTQTNNHTSQKSKKKKKKNKKPKKDEVGAQVGEPPRTDDFDEIDVALRELSMHYQEQGSANGNTVELKTANETHQLLAIETSHLHAANEMRRLFGRAAVQQDDDDDNEPAGAAAGGNRRQQRRMQQGGLAPALRGQRQDGRAGGLTAMALRRNVFIQGKEEWPTATSGGLGMEVEEKRSDGTVLYRYVHNSTYQDVQSQFDSCVASMDPNRLVVLLQHNPYHISTLLQVSEIAKQERDHAVSGDLLERALFSFGRAVHSTFVKNLVLGKARLDFRRAENREFWLASWRYMQNLTMRATWRTVYEWAKLLLSLSPDDDAYAIWLVLDQYALRSKQDLDYLNISRSADFKDRLKTMPNVQLSRGLAEYRAGNKSKGKQALFTAIGKFPWVIAKLMQELNLDPPPAIWAKQPRSDKENLYTHLYATRAKDLWNTPETSSLLLEIASAIPPETPTAAIDHTEISRSEARHVLLSDEPPLIALVPRKYTTQLTSASDPLPPDDAFMTYLRRAPGRHPPPGHNTAPDDRELTEMFEEHESLITRLQQFFRRPRPGGDQAIPDANADGENGDLPAFGPLIANVDDLRDRVQAEVSADPGFIGNLRRFMELEGTLRGLGFAPHAGDNATGVQFEEDHSQDEGRDPHHPTVEDASSDEE